MKPYYDEDGCTIYHGDCLEVGEWLSADVLVTDPPYGMNYCSGWMARPISGDANPALRDCALSKWGSKPAIVFGRWDVDRPVSTRLTLIWDKGEWPGMGDLNFPWGISHEEIYVLGHGWAGKRAGTVLRDGRRPSAYTHPNEKPLGLLYRLLERAPSGVVADPFAGAGSVLVAARQMNRRAIGIEIEERYCEIAAKRLSQRVFDFTGTK